MSDFKTTYLCSGYIYCTFYTCHHLEHILIFNINLVWLGVIWLAFWSRSLKGRPQFPKSDGKPDDASVGGFLRGPYFLCESWDQVLSSHLNPNIPSPMMNKWQKTPYFHNYPFNFAGTYSLLHHCALIWSCAPFNTTQFLNFCIFSILMWCHKKVSLRQTLWAKHVSAQTPKSFAFLCQICPYRPLLKMVLGISIIFLGQILFDRVEYIPLIHLTRLLSTNMIKLTKY